MLQTGYILNRRDDLIWFIGLPVAAIAFAMASQQWLPVIALASVNLWITIPHHFATWLRTYGLSDDWKRWNDRLIVGPIVILTFALVGLKWAPLTAVMVVVLWDHQHSLMQQHGLARIYDFKAGAGLPSTRRFDLGLNWFLYGNLLLTAPLFASVWLRWLYRWGLPVSAETVSTIQMTSWLLTGVYCAAYAMHVVWCLRCGAGVNPLKYVFLGASYFLWYFTAWQTASLLVHGIAHRIMHGLQYIVIAYWYTRRKVGAGESGGAARLVRPGKWLPYVGACAVYAIGYQLLIGRPLIEFGFGLASLESRLPAIPQLGLGGVDAGAGYDLLSVGIINTAALTHYYFDSFIWKVREPGIQRGL